MSTKIDLQPSDWFKERWNTWQSDLCAWHSRHTELKDPAKKAAFLAARSAAKAAEEAEAKSREASKDDSGQDGSKIIENENKESSAGDKERAKTAEGERASETSKKDVDVDADEDMDPMERLGKELDEADFDVFDVESISDTGNGEPLYQLFSFEDWALLSLRYELHLLCSVFARDAQGEDRTGVALKEVVPEYKKYFKKDLVPKNYGLASVDEILALIKDTVVVIKETVESRLPSDYESNDIFVKLTEEGRRERQRTIDAGDSSVSLSFNSSLGANFNGPGDLRTTGIKPKSASLGLGMSVNVPMPDAPPGSLLMSGPPAAGVFAKSPGFGGSSFSQGARPKSVSQADSFGGNGSLEGYGSGATWVKGKDFGKDFGNDFGKGYGKDFGKDYGKDSGKGGFGGKKGGYGKDSFGKDGFGKDGFGKDSYGKDSYGKDSYGKDSYGKDSYGKDSYGKDSYGKDSFGKDGYGKGGWGKDSGKGWGDKGGKGDKSGISTIGMVRPSMMGKNSPKGGGGGGGWSQGWT